MNDNLRINQLKQIRQKAATLVVTLLVLALMSTIVVAFLQSVSLERSAARSVANRYQAELAAQAGLNAAIAQIQLATSSNQTFVTGLFTNVPAGFGPITTIGITNLVDQNQLMPLISTDFTNLVNFGSSSWNGFTNIIDARAGTNTADLNANNPIQVTPNTNLFRAPWVVYSTNSLGIVRYSYFVLDEHARVNPLFPGPNSALTNSTNWYSGPQDLILTNSSSPLLSRSQQDAILNSANVIFTKDTLAQAISSRTDYDNIKHLLTTSKNPTYDAVPAQFPFITNAFVTNRAKISINNFATNNIYGASTAERATNLANLIYSNIPSLGSRDPSLRGNAENELTYLRRLSASIIDYLTDANSPPTIVNGGEPTGQKLVPQVTAITIRYRRVDLTSTSTTIESQPFVQVWNPFTAEINTDGKPIKLELKNMVNLFFGSGIVIPFNDYNRTISPSINIRPNEFVVLEFPSVSQTWRSPEGPVSNPRIPGGISAKGDGLYWPTFEFYYNNFLVSMTRKAGLTLPISEMAQGGLEHEGINFSDTKDRFHSNFIPTQNSAPNWRFVGDPRASYLTSYIWKPITSYKDLTKWKGIQDDVLPRSQNFKFNWQNRDFVRENPATGDSPDNDSEPPTDVDIVYNDEDRKNAISVIKNGSINSTGELGHVYDPVQAADDLTAPTVSAGSEFPNKFGAGGGRTLRVGQPEFSVNNTNSWATNASNPNDRAAIQLLDLLSANPTNAAGFPFAIGRINPNTAPAEVLSSILSGIRISSDAGVPPANLTNLTELAAAIVTNRPYSKISDFRKFIPAFAAGTNYSPSIPASVGGGTTNLAVMDRMREEAFGKLVPHLTVQSRTYRIIVMGELLDRSQRPVSRAQMEAVVFFEINPNGGTTPVIQWRKIL